MNLSQYLPLTETTYYILIALLQPGHGYYAMQRVEELSQGKVRIAAGTMYGALDNLSRQKWIQPVPSGEKRRKVYQVTDLGREVLRLETQRLRDLIRIADQYAL